MIKFNERNISSSILTSTIKTKCKINSYYYFIQIFIDSIAGSEKITFLIKTRKECERNSILYKRVFNYIELINYNKYFKKFSSLEDIFINIAQCIEEKKYNINKGLKCLSLILRIYISKLKKDVNITINLNMHKNLNPLSMDKTQTKEIKKIILGVQNKEELSYAIYDIRQRLKNLEMNQSMMNNNNINNNGNITYRNNEINRINNNFQKYINNSINLNENMNNNDFQIKYYKENPNKRKLNNKISVNSSMNNLYEESNIYHQNNSILNKTNTNYFKNSSTNNLIPKNIKINEKHRISGVNELIKKINILETKTNTKDIPIKESNYKFNSIDSYNNDNYKYIPSQRQKKEKNKEFNKSVEINRRNDNSLYNLYNNNINNMAKINLVKKNQLNSVFNNEKSMNGSQIIDIKENDNINNNINNIKEYNNNINNINEYNNNINNINEYNNNIFYKKFINKNKTIDYNENEFKENLGRKIKNNLINIKNEELVIKKIDDNGYLSKSKTGRGQKVKVKKKVSEEPKIPDNKIINNNYENNNNNNKNIIKKREKEQENGNSNSNSNDNLDNLNGKNNVNNSINNNINNNINNKINNSINNNNINNSINNKIKDNNNNNINKSINNNINNNSESSSEKEEEKEKESEKIKKSIKKESTKKKEESKNNSKVPKIKIKNYSSAIKNNSNYKNYNNINNNVNNNININSSVNSLSSKPIIKQNLNKSISSSTSNMEIKTPKKVPIYPPEKLNNINSNIIFRKVELHLLQNKLSNNNKKLHVYFDLLYRATRDGDNDTVIKKLTLGYEKVMTLFYTNEGARFGIFIRRKKNHYLKAKNRGEKSGTCFIFGLNNLVIYDIYKDKYGKGDYNKVLCFGCLDDVGSNGTKWMIYTPQNDFLNKKCVMDSGIGLFHEIDIEQIVGPPKYTIKEVEIFNVEIE